MKNNFFVFLLFFISCVVFSSCATFGNRLYTAFDYKVNEVPLSLPYESPERFTIAVLPDIQNYTNYKYQKEYKKSFPADFRDMALRQTEFVAKNSIKNGGSIVFAIFLGDMVNTRSKKKCEWEYADQAVTVLDDVIPFGIVIGNHDYDYWKWSFKISDVIVEGGSFFNAYFGPTSKHFSKKSWYGGASENGLNSYSIFKAGERTFLFIGLEFEPSDEALEWAQQVINDHKDMPVIVATHGYLSYNRVDTENGNYSFLGLHHHLEGTGNGGRQIFNKLVRKNKNIFLVLCGHVFDVSSGEGMRVDIDDDGYKVYSIVSNYQKRADYWKINGFKGAAKPCGDGFLRLMNFDMKRKIINVQTYSTEFNTFEIDADSDFSLDIDWDWNERFSSR